MVALDGNPVEILVEADLQFQRLDGPVSLPRVHVKASVVRSLAAVGAYIHPWPDVIAGIGGVNIGYDESGELNPTKFGPGTATSGITATTVCAGEHRVRHVTVTKDDIGVTLEADNGLIRWNEDTEQWRWKDGRTSSNLADRLSHLPVRTQSSVRWSTGSIMCRSGLMSR